MPWSDNSNGGDAGTAAQKPGPGGANGPSGGGEKPPRKPNGGPSAPPPITQDDLGALWRKLQQRFAGLRGPGDGLNPNLLGVGIAVVVFLWLLSGIYFVQPAEQGVVTTFGAYSRETGLGAHWRFVPFEAVQKVPVEAVQQVDIGGNADNENLQESLMLTGDENIVNLTFTVQYRISDAFKYLFRVTDPDATVKAVAESAIREVVGKSKLKDITTTGRAVVQQQTADLMQRVLDNYGAGVSVDEVNIVSASPPKEVLPDFQAVTSAGQYADSAVNEANTYRNQKIYEAKGDAAKLVQAADAYREQTVDQAQGDAARFNQIYDQYKRAPAVTRERRYLESMQRVLARSNKVIVDTHGATAPIILPPDAFRPRSAPDQTATPAPTSPSPPAQSQTSASPGAAQ